VRGVVDGEQALLVLALLRRAPRQLDAGALGEDAQRLDRLEPVLLLQPGERITRLPTSEAAVGPAFWIDVEGRRLLVVERAQPGVRPPGAAQLDPALLDELDEVDTLLDEVEVARRFSDAPTRPG
jgi:hypothetical protein